MTARLHSSVTFASKSRALRICQYAVARGALNLPVAIVPTIASHDSPTSHIAVVYTADHAVDEVRLMRVSSAWWKRLYY